MANVRFWLTIWDLSEKNQESKVLDGSSKTAEVVNLSVSVACSVEEVGFTLELSIFDIGWSVVSWSGNWVDSGGNVGGVKILASSGPESALVTNLGSTELDVVATDGVADVFACIKGEMSSDIFVGSSDSTFASLSVLVSKNWHLF